MDSCSELLFQFERQVLPKLGPRVCEFAPATECMLCDTLIQQDEAIHVEGRGGPVCRDCVEAIARRAVFLDTESDSPQ